MVICDSSEQAKMMAEIFEAKYSTKVVPIEDPIAFAPEPMAAETPGIARLPSGSSAPDSTSYNAQRKADRAVTTSALILHDVGTKQDRKDQVEAFKEGKNALLRAKYANDAKYARLHKRLLEKYPLSDKERALCEALNAFKTQADEKLSQNAQLLQNEDFAERELLRLAVAQFNTTHHFGFDATTMKDISKMVFKEYLDESKGKVPA